MAPGSTQFTPRQLLDAGRRAEAEGKPNLAQQFYAHLSDRYGHTAEAAEGRRGLARLGASGTQPQVWQMNGTAGASPALARGRGKREGPAAGVSGYRVGRVLALLLSGVGWLTMGVALLVLVAAAAEFAQLPPPQVVRLDFATPPQAAGALAAGAVALLIGEGARALFDQASAVRELVALARARAGDGQS
jgi:hypothetical protein